MTAAAAAPDSSASPYMANSSTGSEICMAMTRARTTIMPNSQLRIFRSIKTVGQPAAQRPGDGDADHQQRGVHHGRADGIHMPPVEQIDRHRRREEGEGAKGDPVKVRHQPYHHARTVHGEDFTQRRALELPVRRIGRKEPVDQRHQQCCRRRRSGISGASRPGRSGRG